MDVDNKYPAEFYYDVERCKKDLEGCTVLIASTRNHLVQKPKEYHAPPRFRVLIPWESRITCPHTYEKSMRYAMEIVEGSDKAGRDSARQFFPSKEVLFSSGDGEKMPVIIATQEEIADAIAVDQYYRQRAVAGPIPGHIVEFLKSGKVFGGSRNTSVYTSSLCLLQKGFTFTEILELVENAPFNRSGFSSAELKGCIHSAMGKNKGS